MDEDMLVALLFLLLVVGIVVCTLDSLAYDWVVYRYLDSDNAATPASWAKSPVRRIANLPGGAIYLWLKDRLSNRTRVHWRKDPR